MLNDTDRMIKEAQHGNKQAFAGLYDLFADKIFRYIRMKIREKEPAEDLLQDIFIKCWKSLGQFTVPGNFQAWLYRIATNSINDHFRTMYRRPQTVELNEEIDVHSSEDIAEETFAKMETEKVKDAFKYLPAVYAQVLQLRFIEDLSVDEVARIVGKTNVTVRVIQYRALKKLREILTERYDLGYTKV